MKRLIFIPLLIFSITLSAQFTKSGGTFLKSGNAFISTPAEVIDYYDEYDPIYTAYVSKPSGAIADIQEALVYSLDTMDFVGGASVWDRMDLFYVFCNNTEDNSLVNWAAPGTYNATKSDVDDINWTQNEGFAMEVGSYRYINTNCNLSTAGGNFTQNSASVGYYVRTDTDASLAAYGVEDATNSIVGLPRNGSGATYRLNSTYDTSEGVAGITTAQGLWISTRRGANVIEVYQNGTSMDAEGDASNGIPNGDLHIGHANGVGSTSNPAQIAIFFVMNGVTDEEAAAIYTIIETFMDALGKGVVE